MIGLGEVFSGVFSVRILLLRRDELSPTTHLPSLRSTNYRLPMNYGTNCTLQESVNTTASGECHSMRISVLKFIARMQISAMYVHLPAYPVFPVPYVVISFYRLADVQVEAAQLRCS